MLTTAKNYVLGLFIKEVLNDPIYKTYYCYKVVDNHNDNIITSVMCHTQAMIFEVGLRQKILLGEIISFEIIAQGDEDEVTEEKYLTEKLLKIEFNQDVKE